MNLPNLGGAGVSPIFGMVLVIGIFTGLLVILYSAYSAGSSKTEEAKLLASVEKAFIQLKEAVERMENGGHFLVDIKMNAGGWAGGTLAVKPHEPPGGDAYGRLEFASKNLQLGDLTFIFEGGAVIENGKNGMEMISPPALITISEVEEENVIRWIRLDVHHIQVENYSFQMASNRPKTLRVACTYDNYLVYPETGRPNRTEVTIDLGSRVATETREVWKSYLESLVTTLPMYYRVSLDPSSLTLTVKGFRENSDIADIFYYERLTKITIGMG